MSRLFHINRFYLSFIDYLEMVSSTSSWLMPSARRNSHRSDIHFLRFASGILRTIRIKIFRKILSNLRSGSIKPQNACILLLSSSDDMAKVFFSPPCGINLWIISSKKRILSSDSPLIIRTASCCKSDTNSPFLYINNHALPQPQF